MSQKDQYMLNKSKIALAGAIAAAALVSTGANAATQTATAEVDILAAVQLAQNDSMDLGVVAATASGGTVVLPTATNVRTCTGVVCAGAAQRGRFTVSGAANGYVVGITVPASTTLSSGANSMTLTLTPSLTSFTSNGTDEEFFVGGSLAVGANQVAGTYTGTYNVSAEYQ
jgi:Mat/Ecp fimbriae major subunit